MKVVAGQLSELMEQENRTGDQNLILALLDASVVASLLSFL